MGAQPLTGTRRTGRAALTAAAGLAAGAALALALGPPVGVAALGCFALGVVISPRRARALPSGPPAPEPADRVPPAGVPVPVDQRYASLVASAPVGIVGLDRLGRVVHANPRWQALVGHQAGVAGADVWARAHPDDRAAMAGRWARALRQGEEFRARFRLRHADGVDRWVIGRTSPIVDGAGRVTGHAGMVLEVHDLVEARHNLLRFQTIIETTSDLVGITDGQGRPLYLNHAAREALGIPGEADLQRLDPAGFYTEESWSMLLDQALPALRRGDVWRGQLALRRADGEEGMPISNVLLARRSPGGTVDFIASIARDTTEQRRLEERLQHEADHDRLTGLANRLPFLHWLGEALEQADRSGTAVAVLFSDIDQFKVVNDSLGHEAGDRVLVAMARRLVSAIRPDDRVARFGGDEFVVLCTGIRDEAEAAEVADRLRGEVGGRFTLGDEEVFVTASIGVALATGRESAEDLLRDADAAMYEAKARGRDRVQLFDASVRARVVERLDIEQALRYAIERDELRLDFQPIIELPDGRISGVEALVRWHHPARGLLQPAQFLRVAEETGMIVELGRWILTEACRTARALLGDRGTEPSIPLFVNLSARQLVDLDLVSMVGEVIDLTGVDPGSVHFEITEDALMADAATTSSTLARLRDLGVRLALDDFGTGHSSLAYLKQFPVETVKIDRTFIEGLGRDPGDRAITGAIVDVARMLGLATVAEGVERPDQAAELTQLGCDLAQGFHFARPMTAEALAALLWVPAIEQPGPAATV
jgi:diguanylate cyclase (GGDEF)-like protein/PAS domain S-box-containing protein